MDKKEAARKMLISFNKRFIKYLEHPGLKEAIEHVEGTKEIKAAIFGVFTGFCKHEYDNNKRFLESKSNGGNNSGIINNWPF